MVDARGAEESMTWENWGRKHGEGSSKTAYLVTAREEDYYHATNTKASENVSAILPIEILIGF